MKVLLWIGLSILGVLALIGFGAGMINQPALTAGQTGMAMGGAALSILIAFIKGKPLVIWGILGAVAPVPVVIIIILFLLTRYW